MEKKKSTRGRPCSLDRNVIELIASGVAQGMTKRSACMVAGVPQSSFCRWMERGQSGKSGIYWELWNKVKDAEESAKQYHLDLLKEHATGGRIVRRVQERRNEKGELIGTVETIEQLPPSLQASIWYLERNFPEEFGPRQRVDVGNKDENPFQVSLFGQCCLPGSADQGPDTDSDE